jgi:hypothetical protein
VRARALAKNSRGIPQRRPRRGRTADVLQAAQEGRIQIAVVTRDATIEG